ncbi:hypothetical protein CAOG_01123 [Capsaspora owczarzaki ATCC 30864]|uniref:Uncharacterized protein n=1 Tax=Capsaspora owczarzaki (strain ATCC 30864) TaxID=595528 RepID=A0A0D2WIL4_CAPO3|nr:hypothetical protein CAOG_01123 [Capsaspora owczarzaki ATCC 30864]KJE89690.1 hypothetical protein CAOG_001123 [Capsaspora owczarzaki ATCC 30864]|eukprot:XP_004365994.2 hypothetical protein CAOG_01123 [Capsaspora owczarzaki ATCC 30864]
MLLSAGIALNRGNRRAWTTLARKVHSKGSISPIAPGAAAAAAAAALQQQQQQQGNRAPGILFDIDGVLIRGNTVLNEAKEAFQMLSKRHLLKNIPYMFVTNGGGTTEAHKAHQLSKWLHVPVSEKQVVLSHTPLRMYEQYFNKTVLLIGQGPLKEIAASYGFQKTLDLDDMRKAFPLMDIVNMKVRKQLKSHPPTPIPVPPVEAIFVMHDPLEWESCLQVLIDLLISKDGVPGTLDSKQHIPIIFSNADFLWMAEHPQPRFGQGAFRLCLEALYKELTGRDLLYTQLGKPFGVTYDYAEKLLNEQAQKLGYDGLSYFYMVGDNPRSDVRGANSRQNGRSVLVRTGVFSPHLDNDPSDPAHFVVPHVRDAVQLVMRHFDDGLHHHGGSDELHAHFVQKSRTRSEK